MLVGHIKSKNKRVNMKSKIRLTTVRFVCIVLAFAILFGSAAVLVADLGNSNVALAAKQDSAQATTPIYNDLISGSNEVYLPSYDTEVITDSNLKKPTVKTFGNHEASYYPSYTNKLESADFGNDKKQAILEENQKMLADVNQWYEAGTLKANLKKHVSADGQFSKNGSYDNAPRIEKVVTVNNVTSPRKRSLGVFAPAGEVLTITIDERLVGKLTVNIGYPYEANDIGTNQFGRWPNDRMARFFLSFRLNATVNYIGSPLGGMVTLDGVDKALGNFDITISGGVDMPNYKLGVSTKQDWKNILAAPAPYVWLLTPHQYFVMPKEQIKDVEDPYLAMLWWHKASMISMYSMARENTGHFTTPVITIYDSYVFVGEAVATVWAFYTNAPSYWCKGTLDYDNLMYGGAWGALHEYNHHHQAHSYASTEWGVGGASETTNNVINALCYVLLTDVATTRSETNVFNGWAATSDPYCSYKILQNASANAADYEAFGTNKLYGFVDMIHTFGAAKFVEFLRAMYGFVEVDGFDGENLTQSNYLTTQDGFTLFASLFFKTDFVDYFQDVWHFKVSNSVVRQISKHNFGKYFSITNLYSAGVKGVETGRAYKVSAGESTVLKLDEFTLTSANSYKLAKVSKPKHGTLTDNKDGTYTYLADSDFVDDSFDLTYQVKVGGKSYKRTLVVKLVNADVAQAERAAANKTYPAFADFRSQFLSLWYSDFITTTPSEVKCLDNNGNAVKTTGADINNMFDGNTSTGFHTAWQGAITAYPHNYYFTFDEATDFNRINFTFQDNGTKGYYAIGEYEIYTSNDGENYQLLTSGNNTETNFNVQFEHFVTAKYVKLVVKSNASGKNFTNITEMEFAQSINMGADYNVYSSGEAMFNYQASKWTDVSGNYMNSKAKHTSNGKVSFYLTGTDLMLYSTNAQSKITIDGTTYTIKANDKEYAPSFIIEGLTKGQHYVEIEGVDMTLDMVKIGTEPRASRAETPARNGLDTNWVGLGVAIFVAALFVGTVIAFVVTTLKQRKKNS